MKLGKTSKNIWMKVRTLWEPPRSSAPCLEIASMLSSYPSPLADLCMQQTRVTPSRSSRTEDSIHGASQSGRNSILGTHRLNEGSRTHFNPKFCKGYQYTSMTQFALNP